MKQNAAFGVGGILEMTDKATSVCYDELTKRTFTERANFQNHRQKQACKRLVGLVGLAIRDCPMMVQLHQNFPLGGPGYLKVHTYEYPNNAFNQSYVPDL